MNKRVGMLIAMAILSAGLLLTVGFAQGPHAPRPQNDLLAEHVFPPELVMQHQREIALTDEQKAFLRRDSESYTPLHGAAVADARCHGRTRLDAQGRVRK